MTTAEQYEYVRIDSRVYGRSTKELDRLTNHFRNIIRRILRGVHKGDLSGASGNTPLEQTIVINLP